MNKIYFFVGTCIFFNILNVVILKENRNTTYCKIKIKKRKGGG